MPTRLQDSDGEKSDQDLVVDIANETVSSKNKTNQNRNSQEKSQKMHNEDSPEAKPESC